jgi:hypothetical protein
VCIEREHETMVPPSVNDVTSGLIRPVAVELHNSPLLTTEDATITYERFKIDTKNVSSSNKSRDQEIVNGDVISGW